MPDFSFKRPYKRLVIKVPDSVLRNDEQWDIRIMPTGTDGKRVVGIELDGEIFVQFDAGTGDPIKEAHENTVLADVSENILARLLTVEGYTAYRAEVNRLSLATWGNATTTTDRDIHEAGLRAAIKAVR